jgi:hypothetical protein
MTMTDHDCLRCGDPMDVVGIEDFRTGGTPGGLRRMVAGGTWAQVTEDLLPLGIMVCGSCGYVELRVPESLPEAPEAPADPFPEGLPPS